MIANLIEIYRARCFPHNPLLKIKNYSNTDTNIAIANIIKKLNFRTGTDTNIYERYCKIEKLNTISSFKKDIKLKYFMIDKLDNDIGLDYKVWHSILNKYMTKVVNNSFVHLAWSEIDEQNLKQLHTSTGYKYDTKFIFQGSELKFALDSNLYQIINRKHFYNYLVANDPDGLSFLLPNYEKNPNDELNLDNLSNQKLLNGKKFYLKLFFLVYVSGGITRCFIFDDFAVNIFEDFAVNKIKENNFINKDNLPDYINKDKLNKLIHTISNGMVNVGMKPYAESNAGFLIFSTRVLLTDNGDPYILNIYNIVYHTQYSNLFSTKYFNWIANNIIFPHFGISSYLPALAISHDGSGPLHSYMHILKNITLYFIHDYECSIVANTTNKIGKILLKYNEKEMKIEIVHIEINKFDQNKGIGTAIIAQLLEILAARTAPLNLLIFFTTKLENMTKIAHNLHFNKQENIFSRFCRV